MKMMSLMNERFCLLYWFLDPIIVLGLVSCLTTSEWGAIYDVDSKDYLHMKQTFEEIVLLYSVIIETKIRGHCSSNHFGSILFCR